MKAAQIDAAHPVAIITGWTEAGYVIEQAELPGGDEHTVHAYVEAVSARFEARHARTAEGAGYRGVT